MILNLSAVQFPHLQNEGNDNACFMHLRVVRIKLYDKVIYSTCLVLYKYIYIYILFFNIIIYLFTVCTVLDLHCCIWTLSSYSTQGLVTLFQLMYLAELVLSCSRHDLLLGCRDSLVVAHRLSCSKACGILVP